jgi:sugar phosphate isomerase/epimerase
MEICNSTWSFHRLFEEGAVDAFSFPKECRQFGITALEYVEMHVGGKSREHLDQLIETVKNNGCEIVAVALENDFTHIDAEESSRQIDHVREWMQIAKYLGAKVVRVNTGGHDIADPDAAVIRVVQCLKDLLRTAEETEVSMALENHGGLSSNPKLVERIVNGVDSTYFGTCPDFGNFPPEVDRYEALALLSRYAKHAHAKSFAFDEEGEETRFDFKRIIGILRDAGYNGYLSIEFEGQGDQREGTRRTAELLRRYL